MPVGGHVALSARAPCPACVQQYECPPEAAEVNPGSDVFPFLKRPEMSEATALEEASSPARDNAHDVHALAAEAAARTAEVEKFFDDVLIDDFKATPLNTMEEVLGERKERDERASRLAARTKELMDEEIAKQKHEREVKELEEVAKELTATEAKDGKPGSKSGSRSGGAGSSSSSAAAADAEPAPAPFKLESAGRKKSEVNNPYVLNLTEFVPEQEATRAARDLRAENDVLRACLKDTKNPKAFESYLRRSTHTVA